MMLRARHRKPVALLFALAMIAVMLVAAAAPASSAPGDWTLTILHNNDMESQLIDAGEGLEDFGGAARFKTVVDDLRAGATTDGVVLLSSGDNFLAGPEFNVSLDKGVPFFDSIAAEAFGYDALALGNHDFDFGPDVLEDFIAGFTATQPPTWLAANLDFSLEPGLQAYVTSGDIAPSVTLSVSGEDVGVIGLETPNLPFISSPRDVIIDDDLVAVVQAEIDALELAGVDKIILAGHLQNISNDIQLAAEVTGLDVIIAGGGDELLANPADVLLPGDVADPTMPYPMLATDKDGKTVPVVTTSGELKYLGKLEVTFDASGEVTAWSGGPVRVEGTPDPGVQAAVVDPVEAALAALDADILTTTTVDLDGRRSSVRAVESNEGNLVADSQLWQARELAADFGVKEADVAIQNGGGIRNDSIIPAGDISVLDTFDMLPFSNFTTVLEDVPAAQFKEIVENLVACTQGGDFAANPNCGSGRFGQIAGFSYTYDPAYPALVLDDVGGVVVAGERVRNLTLDDGTPIVVDGILSPLAPDITVATADFLAKGGDQYPFRGHPFTQLGVTYQKSLQNYLESGIAVDDVNYPEGGEGRITLNPAGIMVVENATGVWRGGSHDPFFFGNPGDQWLSGDWDCNGSDTPGVLRSGVAYLRNTNDSGPADMHFLVGNAGDVGLAGDFDGDGCDTVSVYRPANQTVYIFNETGMDGEGLGAADSFFVFGDPGDHPFAADFDGDGIDTVGVMRGTNYLLRNTNDQGNADVDFVFGAATDQPVFGDWNGDRSDTVGAYDTPAGEVNIRFTNTSGARDSVFPTFIGDYYGLGGRFG